MHIWITNDERGYGVFGPGGSARWNGDESDEQWKSPQLPDEAKEETLVDAFGEPRPEKELEYEQDIRRNRE